MAYVRYGNLIRLWGARWNGRSMAVTTFMSKLIMSLSLVLLSYSCGIFLLAITMRKRPELVRDVILTPLARLGPYGLACAVIPCALFLLVGVETAMWRIFLMFTFTLALPLTIALILSSLVVLLGGLLRYGQRTWYPIAIFLCPTIPGFYIIYNVISELILFLPEVFTLLLAIFTPLFCISGVLEHTT